MWNKTSINENTSVIKDFMTLSILLVITFYKIQGANHMIHCYGFGDNFWDFAWREREDLEAVNEPEIAFMLPSSVIWLWFKFHQWHQISLNFFCLWGNFQLSQKKNSYFMLWIFIWCYIVWEIWSLQLNEVLWSTSRKSLFGCTFIHLYKS